MFTHEQMALFYLNIHMQSKGKLFYNDGPTQSSYSLFSCSSSAKKKWSDLFLEIRGKGRTAYIYIYIYDECLSKYFILEKYCVPFKSQFFFIIYCYIGCRHVGAAYGCNNKKKNEIKGFGFRLPVPMDYGYVKIICCCHQLVQCLLLLCCWPLPSHHCQFLTFGHVLCCTWRVAISLDHLMNWRNEFQ
jgi:hypothetical protein